MNRTRTQLLIDEVAMWSALAVYLVLWVAGLSNGFETSLLMPALGVSCLYVGMHVYEITKRHHCYLCADSTAVPVTLLAAAIGSGVAHFAYGVESSDIGRFISRGMITCLLAHVVVLVYAAILTTLSERLFRQRIDAEHVQMLENNRLQNRMLGI